MNPSPISQSVRPLSAQPLLRPRATPPSHPGPTACQRLGTTAFNANAVEILVDFIGVDVIPFSRSVAASHDHMRRRTLPTPPIFFVPPHHGIWRGDHACSLVETHPKGSAFGGERGKNPLFILGLGTVSLFVNVSGSPLHGNHGSELKLFRWFETPPRRVHALRSG